MTPYRLRLVALVVVLAGCASSFVCGQTTLEPAPRAFDSGGRRPANIVLIVADDLGYGELGCQGNEQIPTPHIDRLAETGTRFTNGYVTAPNCSPSRAGLLTGKIPTRFGYEFNPIGARNEDPGTGLPRSEVTLADRLRKLGYATGMFGKWHLGGTADFHPQRRGFDEFYGFLHEGHFFVPPPYRGTTTWLRRKFLPAGSAGDRYTRAETIWSSHMGHNEPPYDANNPILRSSQPEQENEYLTDAWSREAVDFIDRHREQPFFLYVPYNAVHSPLQAPNEELAKFSHIEDIQRRIFAAMLSRLDRGVGKILDKLDALSLASSTLVIFISDNGGPTKELTSSNAPLRGGKGTMYEGGLRVPFIVRWPQQAAHAQSPELLDETAADRSAQARFGVVCDIPVWTPDLTPTILAAAGGEMNAEETDGVPLLDLTTRDPREVAPRPFFWRQGNRTALRFGNWKIVSSSLTTSPDQWQLFQIDNDISESHDMSKQHADTLEELIGVWQGFNDRMAEPIFGR